MILIGKLYTISTATTLRVCADIKTDQKNFTMWYETDKENAHYLCTERCDSFVVALLPLAFRTKQDIICEHALSAQLHYQLSQYYINIISKYHTDKHLFSISAPLAYDLLPSKAAVGAGFSGGVDSMYTLATHGKNSTYPITHLATLNVGSFEEKVETPALFRLSYERLQPFANSMGLKAVWLNTNFHLALQEPLLYVELFRHTAGALALQKLFSIYLHASSKSIATFSVANQKTFSAHGFLADTMLSTQNCSIYPSGFEIPRIEKQQYLYNYAPSYEWLHPCIMGVMGDKNCGKCLKCKCLGLNFYIDDVFGKYAKIFDAQEFIKNLDEHVMTIFRTERIFESVNDTINHFMTHKKDEFLQIRLRYAREKVKKS